MRRLSVIALLFAGGCSHGAPPAGSSDGSGSEPGTGEFADGPVSVPDATIDSAPDAQSYRFLCSAPRPAHAPVPDSPPLSTGCTPLVAGTNTITTSAKSRQFMMVLPANLQPDERLPVIFMWYWLGGSAQGFIDKGQVQAAADDERFIAVLPIDEGAEVLNLLNTRWPFDITQTQARMDEEFTFFDDMLSCVEQQYNVNSDCVSTAGVSAGALFTDQLAQGRSTTLSSFLSMSGGVNDTIIRGWNTVPHPLPGIVLWGGDGPPTMDGVKDILGCLGIGMDFSVASKDMETALVANGNFFIECKHNCGHVEPPLPTPADGETPFAGMWEFAWNHPYWLAPGDSPYLTTGLPDTLPSWCGIGANSAVPRSGSGCPPAENPCAF